MSAFCTVQLQNKKQQLAAMRELTNQYDATITKQWRNKLFNKEPSRHPAETGKTLYVYERNTSIIHFFPISVCFSNNSGFPSFLSIPISVFFQDFCHFRLSNIFPFTARFLSPFRHFCQFLFPSFLCFPFFRKIYVF